MKYLFLLMFSLALNATPPELDIPEPSGTKCILYQQLEQKRGCNNFGHDYAVSYGLP